ncbi:MAG: DUF459 domain-containing protein [Acidimicrobiales bacterium]|jgi:hypothetical protein|nr:DUF459 domain-containing protein [Acidimicrobiales bacterium]
MKNTIDSQADHPANLNGFAAGRVFVVGLLGLGVAICLNSSTLLAEAERLPDSASRSISVAVWTPIESVASALKLTWPREVGDRLLGRSKDEQPIILIREQVEMTNETNLEQEELVVESVQRERRSEGSSSTSASESVDPPWTEDNPLNVWVAGDSMVQFFGDTFVSMAEKSSVVEGTSEPQLSSGLSRPDYFDWPTRIAEIMTEHDPDVIVLMFGGNDAQNIRTVDGRWLERLRAPWTDEYRRRVGLVMDIATADNERIVLWVGQPPMRAEGFDTRMQLLNEVYQAEADKRLGVHYVDLRSMFTDASGKYARYLPDPSGKLVDVRLSDGVHLSHWGGEWLSKSLLAEISRVGDGLGELWP